MELFFGNLFFLQHLETSFPCGINLGRGGVFLFFILFSSFQSVVFSSFSLLPFFLSSFFRLVGRHYSDRLCVSSGSCQHRIPLLVLCPFLYFFLSVFRSSCLSIQKTRKSKQADFDLMPVDSGSPKMKERKTLFPNLRKKGQLQRVGTIHVLQKLLGASGVFDAKLM